MSTIFTCYEIRMLQWIAIILGFKIGGYGKLETMMISSLYVQFYLEGRLGLSGASSQQESPDNYSYGEEVLINPVWIKKIVE